MALQPAAGAKDLNPQQVETNQFISSLLAETYRLWGYEEVAPPRVERLDTLMACGAISSNDIVKLVASEPLGLRPEMTASIARAACTRLSEKPRPLRLWATGTVFQSRESVEGGLCIEETLQSGVEIFGIKNISAEMELMSLLLKCMQKLSLSKYQNPTLLIGHTLLMDLILSPYENSLRDEIRQSLINYNSLELKQLNLEKDQKERLVLIHQLRGEPKAILEKLEGIFGNQEVIYNLRRLFSIIAPIAEKQGLTIQLDPTFQPQLELYTGIVFQLLCRNDASPVVVARGGRYDHLVRQCGAKEEEAAGLGFSFSIEKLRELFNSANPKLDKPIRTLVVFGEKSSLEKALRRQNELHDLGHQATVELTQCNGRKDATELLALRNCNKLEWLN